nr:hypothetical protein [Tanacetum cinerariifolium]
VNNPSFLGRIVPLFDSMLVHQGEGLGTPTEPHHTPSPEAQQSSPTAPSSPSLPSVTTETIPTVIPTDIPTLRQYSRRARIAQSSDLPTTTDEPTSPLGDDSQYRGGAEPFREYTIIKGRSLEIGEEACVEKSTKRGSNDTEELVNVLTSLDAASILTSGV